MTAFVTLIGTAGKNAENKNGTAKFSVAINHNHKGVKCTTWYDVSAFDSVVERAMKVVKGSRVTLTGRLTTSTGTDGKMYLNVVASDVESYNPTQQVAAVTAPQSVDDDIAF